MAAIRPAARATSSITWSIVEAEALGLQRAFPEIGPANVKGLEINPYAAELARVSVWIGEIQWMRRNGFAEARNPILKPLDTIECRDAILTPDSAEPEWPKADVVIGNPPFLGGKLLITHLGEEYVSRMFTTYADRVPAEADLRLLPQLPVRHGRVLRGDDRHRAAVEGRVQCRRRCRLLLLQPCRGRLAHAVQRRNDRTKSTGDDPVNPSWCAESILHQRPPGRRPGGPQRSRRQVARARSSRPPSNSGGRRAAAVSNSLSCDT